MECVKPDISEKFVLYMENCISPEEGAIIAAHLEECEPCHEEENSLRHTITLVQTGIRHRRKGHCPEAELLVSYSASPASIKPEIQLEISHHLHYCRECAATLALLNELDRELELQSDPAPALMGMPGTLKEAVKSLYRAKTKEGFLDKIARTLNLRLRFSLLSALAVTILVIGVFTIIFGDLALQREKFPSRPSKTGSEKVIARKSSQDMKTGEDKKIQHDTGPLNCKQVKRRDNFDACCGKATVIKENESKMKDDVQNYRTAPAAKNQPGSAAGGHQEKNKVKPEPSSKGPPIMAKKEIDAEGMLLKSDLEKRLSAQARSYLESAAGMENAEVVVTIIAVPGKESFTPGKIIVVIKSKIPLNTGKQSMIKKDVAEMLDLCSERDAIIIIDNYTQVIE